MSNFYQVSDECRQHEANERARDAITGRAWHELEFGGEISACTRAALADLNIDPAQIEAQFHAA